MPLLGPILLRDPRRLQETYLIDDRFTYLSSTELDSRIHIHHPGYPPNQDLLFSLHTPDQSTTAATDAPTTGVHYGLVLDACAIIADNRRDGWLSTDREGNHCVEGDMDNVLTSGDYWFHVPGLPDSICGNKWPVVTCFQDWEFPQHLPSTWQRIPKPQRPATTTAPSTFSMAILARDVFCRVSEHYTGTETAHICPREEAEWFFANGMSRFNNDTSLVGQSLLDDHANLLLLRSDLHKAFDDRKFVFYPKDSRGFSVHLMEPSIDLGILYHNARTHPMRGCRPEFLYARFAWSIFQFLSGFLSMRVSRAVIVVQNDSERTRVVKINNPQELRERVASSRSRSPRKRKMRSVDAEDDGDVQVDRAVEGGHKRRRHDAHTEPTSITTPPLDPDSETYLEESQSQNSTGPKHDFTATQDENSRIRKLRDEHLQAQRPPGFVPFSGDPWEGTSDARTVLERLGFEIIDD